MHRVWGLVIVITGLVLMLGVTSSWGGPPNNDISDALANTAGGTGALVNNTSGTDNTAGSASAVVLAQVIPSCNTPGQTTCINGWLWVCQCYSYGCQYMATSNRC